MKKKLTKILGVALTVVLLTSLLVASTPTSAKPLGFTSEKHPGNLVENTVVAAISITDMAANGDVIYASTNATPTSTDKKPSSLYKSLDGGATWSSLASSTRYPMDVSVKAVSVATDDPDVVVIVTSDDEIKYSSNGGSSWDDLNNPTNSATANATINCVDVSSGSPRAVAAGGTLSGGAVMYVRDLTMTGSWKEQYTGNAGVDGTHTTALAVRFSPNYPTDKAIGAITSNATGVSFQLFRNESGDDDWNGSIDYLEANWGNGAVLDSRITDVTGTLDAAEIAFPSSYLANDEGERLAYVAIGDDNGGGGVLRLTDTVDSGFQTWSGGELGACGSLAYSEAGILVAGEYLDNKVYQFLSPNAAIPKASRLNTLKQPGGVNKTSVVLSGDTVLAGTQGIGSAVAWSVDDGYTFNDVGLIDVELTNFDDAAVNADGSKVYLTTNNGSATSVWLKEEGAYTRILNLDSATCCYIRIAPEDDETVYVAETGDTEIYVSKNSGKESWKSVPCYKLGTGDTIKDIAVAGADEAYVIDDDGVSKTSNAGASWGAQKRPVEDFTPHSVIVASNGDILVGGTGGYVAYSKDGGSTYDRTKAGGSGDVNLVPDDDYANNNIIYWGSVSDGAPKVYRSKADTTTTPSSTKSPTIDASYRIKGLAQFQSVTYVLSSNGTDSLLHKALNLETAATATLAQWSYISSGSEFEKDQQALKISGETKPKLWAVDTPATLASLEDPIATVAPTMAAPEDGLKVPVNSANGKAHNVNFVFDRYSSTDIKEAQLEIATDGDFKGVIYTGTFDISDITTDTIAKAIGPSGQTTPENQMVDLMPGITYYWRVRTSSPWLSPWSEARSFTVASMDTFMVTGPESGAADASLMPTFTWSEYPDAIGYEIMLSEDPTFAIIEWSYNVDNPFYKVEEELKYSTTYYWRVRGVTGEPYLEGRTWITPAGPWVTGVFTTMGEPVPDEPDVITITEPGAPAEIKVVEVPAPAPVIPTYLLWVIVAVGAVLIIALIILIVRTRRVA
jgi:hypothetical protein